MPGHPTPDKLLIEFSAILQLHNRNCSAVPVLIQRADLDGLPKTQIRCELFSLIAEGLALFGAVYTVEAYLGLSFPVEDSDGIAIGDSNDLGFPSKGSAGKND